MNKIIDRFIRYVKIDTQSDVNPTKFPSTAKQFVLAKMLTEELQQLGLYQVTLDEYGYVYASLPSNIKQDVPALGFIAHIDTSPDISGNNVIPQIFKNYDGGKLILNHEKNIFLSPEISPEIIHYKSQTIITTSGDTLLGADDKAGIAIIVSAVEYLLQHPGIQRPPIYIAFTPDEEIGRGTDHFDTKKFGADYAYTIDGGAIGEIEYENFNAAKVVITFHGRNFHPGYAKGKLINAMNVAIDFDNQLPANEKPENTDGYEGFFFLSNLSGTIELTQSTYLIRDFNHEKFEERKNLVIKICDEINLKYGSNTVEYEMNDQYYNMENIIKNHFHTIENACKAMRLAGVEPVIKQVRGGTDGARISEMGIPCPNLFTGGHNAHGKWEYIVAESMQKAVEVVVKIAELYATENNK